MKKDLLVSGSVVALVIGVLVHAATTLVAPVDYVSAIYSESMGYAEISWPAAPISDQYDVVAYEVNRWCGSTKTWTEEISATTTQTFYSIHDPSPVDGCLYGVIAWTAGSIPSTEVQSDPIVIPTTVPAAPTYVEVWVQADGSVNVEWPRVIGSTAEPVEGYIVDRQCTEGTWGYLSEVLADGSQVYVYLDSTAPGNSTCTYSVRAVTARSEGETTVSSPVTIQVTEVAPPPVSVVTATYYEGEGIAKATWNAVPESASYTVVAYHIYYTFDGVENYVGDRLALNGITSFSFTDVLPKNGAQYGVKTVSGISGLESDIVYSAPLVIPTTAPITPTAPLPPNKVGAWYSDTASRMIIEWSIDLTSDPLPADFVIGRKCTGDITYRKVQTKGVIDTTVSAYDTYDVTFPLDSSCSYSVIARSETLVESDPTISTDVKTPAPQIPVTYTKPPVPEAVKVEYSAGDALIFWQTVISNDPVVEYKLYRQCPGKLPVVTSVTPKATDVQEMKDPNTIEGCEYSVAAVSKEAGEGEQSVFIPVIFPTTTTTPEPLPEPSIVPTDTTIDAVEPLPEKTVDPFIEALKTPALPVSGKWSIGINVYAEEPLKSVEVYIRGTNSTNEEWLGKASGDATVGKWYFPFDSTQKPNGEYFVYSRGVTLSGMKVLGEVLHIYIKNEVVEPVPTRSTDTDLGTLVKDAAADIETADATLADKQALIEDGFADVATEVVGDRERLKEEIRAAFEREMNQMTVFALEGDQAGLEERKRAIAEQFKFTYGEAVAERQEEVAIKVQDRVEELEKLAEERRAMMSERVKADVFKDADQDGISNFDEIYIYKTDPYKIDSDGDGYTDGAEIVGGFDPLNERREAIIEYQEVREAGVVEPSMFSVTSVKTVERKVVREVESVDSKVSTTTDPDDGISQGTTDPQEPETIVETTVGLEFEGSAPPNSFVTLYIYSTPIIVTVKTDADGNWSYVLDKELEDGSHEVYVAMTDNAGQVYMKSNPLNFVKEAQAVTFETPIIPETKTPSFFSQGYVLAVVLTIVVVLIGAIVFIGMRPKRSIEGLEDIESQ